MTTTSRDSGPSSSIGIMRFFDADSGGPKVSPEFVVAIALAFTLFIALLHFT
ncbi:MAG TPA: preprotein translocase subunit Sec61beta [Candidatus Diapherotrites archaeon]|uniref:Preprotein translocase subunit Sec61beta n=1 Tax=Candidatus Iainarchaeum sp. TaxID=3101447 RepID=A0A7J4IUC8_9ARCH|nr:preprotein translocase subunit Sec61beta [Candidatus Diapherotrites archaeon]